MKKLTLIGSLLVLTISLLQAQHDHKQSDTPIDTVKKSIPKEVHTQIGETHMMLHYYAPAVRGRVIWGGLVPLNEIWVTGAHSATSWEFNKDILVDNQTIPAGKYAIFTIPGTETWTIIINKTWNQHLADDYNAKDDVIRVKVRPSATPHQERLLYSIQSKSKTGGELQISWAKVKVVLPFKTTK